MSGGQVTEHLAMLFTMGKPSPQRDGCDPKWFSNLEKWDQEASPCFWVPEGVHMPVSPGTSLFFISTFVPLGVCCGCRELTVTQTWVTLRRGPCAEAAVEQRFAGWPHSMSCAGAGVFIGQ